MATSMSQEAAPAGRDADAACNTAMNTSQVRDGASDGTREHIFPLIFTLYLLQSLLFSGLPPSHPGLFLQLSVQHQPAPLHSCRLFTPFESLYPNTYSQTN